MQRTVAQLLAVFIIIGACIPTSASAVILQCQYVDETTGAVVQTPPITTESAAIPTETTTAIQISELYPAPTTGQEEFIEIYNPNNSAVSISDLTLTDASGKAFTLSESTVESTSLAAHSYLALPFSVTKIFLNNGGDTIVLTNASGVALDQTTYETALSGASWSKHLAQPNGLTTWEFTPTPTAGSANIFTAAAATTQQDTVAATTETTAPTNNTPSTEITTPTTTTQETTTQTSSDIVINELLPNPVGSDTNAEWIELANIGDSDIQLRDWSVSDDAKTYTIKDTILGAGELLLLQSSATKISLNNSGETITLTDPFGSTIDSVQYTASAEGQSYARFHSGFSWTTTPTPGAANSAHAASVVTQKTAAAVGGGVAKAVTPSTATPAQAKTVLQSNTAQTIAAAKLLQDGAEVTVSGTVTALPGQLGTQYFMLQDATSGIQIYSYAKLFPELAIGSKATVSGELGESRGIKRVKISQASDIQITGETTEVAPKNVDELNETLDGTLVQTSSVLADKSSTTWNLENGISAALKSSAGVSAKDFKEGSSVSVTGIVEQVSGVRKIIPRSAQDVTQESAQADTEQANSATVGAPESQATHTAAQNKFRAATSNQAAEDSQSNSSLWNTVRAHPIQITLVAILLLVLLLLGIYNYWNTIEQHHTMQALLKRKRIARLVQVLKNYKLLPSTEQAQPPSNIHQSTQEPQWDFDQLDTTHVNTPSSNTPSSNPPLQPLNIIDDIGVFYALSDEFRRGR